MDAVLSNACARCMLYLVYACTWCLMYLVYAVLSVNSKSWRGEIERDDLTSCSAMIVEFADEIER